MGVGGVINPAPAPFDHHEKKTELADYRLPAAVGGGAGADWALDARHEAAGGGTDRYRHRDGHAAGH